MKLLGKEVIEALESASAVIIRDRQEEGLAYPSVEVLETDEAEITIAYEIDRKEFCYTFSLRLDAVVEIINNRLVLQDAHGVPMTIVLLNEMNLTKRSTINSSKMKIKSFKAISPEILDKDVNRWIEENEGKYFILDVKHSAGSDNSLSSFLVTVLYTETVEDGLSKIDQHEI
jgi:hypothetical protein